MQHRLDPLLRSARLDGPRVGIISTWDVENNAVRILAGTLRHAGHHVAEIYFKDWISNTLDPASEEQLDNLVRIIRREELNLVCISIRASAYAEQAKIITERIHEELGLPVLWGGMHPTLVPEECIEHADLLLKGEGELALLELCNSLRDGSDEVWGSGNVWLRRGKDDVVRNALRPLVQNLDDLQFRDYTTHAHKYFIYGNTYTSGDPMHGDPVFQMMGSRGCIYKCSYCYNSTYKKDV
jgi:anaerobic magnesium-protoporphyrin IX monomethyl ester cyclase